MNKSALLRETWPDVEVEELGPTAVRVLYKKHNKYFESIASSDTWFAKGKSVYYFEATIKQRKGEIYLGLATQSTFRDDDAPGRYKGSWGFVCDRTESFTMRDLCIQDKLPVVEIGDTMGIGLRTGTREIFVTINGVNIGVLGVYDSDEPLVPVVGFSYDAEVALEFHDTIYKPAFPPTSLVPLLKSLDHSNTPIERWSRKVIVLLLLGPIDEATKHQLLIAVKNAARIVYRRFYIQ